MARFIKQRRIQPFEYRAQDQQSRIIESHRVKLCGVCTLQVPEADIVVEDGTEVCPMCRDLYTAEWLATEQKRVADIKAESARRLNSPSQFSIRPEDAKPGIITAITDSSGNFLSQSAPLRMPRTVAVTVLLVGQRFTSANVTSYSAGITNNSAPVITSALITLSLIASSGVTPGSYGITMADGVTQSSHFYPYVLAVR